MKKMVFAFGALLVFSATAGTSMAHYFYQNHNHENLAARPHTERIAPLNYYRQLTKDYYRCGYTGCTREQNLSVPRTPDGVGAYYGQNRQTSDINDMSRYANTYQERYLIVRNGNYKDRLHGYDTTGVEGGSYNYHNADSGDYQVDHPAGFGVSSNGDFRSNSTTLAYRVLGLDQTACDVKNFWTCGQTHNRAFRDSNAFSFVQNVEADARWNQTDHDSFDYFPTITESFDTVVNGNAYTYYTYTALNPLDDTMVRIEGVSSRSEKDRAAKQAFKVFESFQFR